MMEINLLENLIKFNSGLFLGWLFLKLCLPFFNRFFADKPNKRSSHLVIKPRAGGIIFVLFSLLDILDKNKIGLYCLPLAIIGLLDDKYKLPSLLRYIVQFFTATYLIFNSNFFNLISENFFSTPLIILFIIASTGMINFVNFMDGIDGLVGGCIFVIFGTSLFFLNLEINFLLGSIAGFLILNWYPSKVFMGDVGSTFLGAFLVGILFQGNTFEQFLGLLTVSIPLMGDAIICVIRRFFYSENIFTPHKKHLYQRLVIAGWSHSKVSKLYILGTLIISLVLILGGLKFALITAAVELIVGIWLDKKVAVHFLSV